jgi:hypothetical protein
VITATSTDEVVGMSASGGASIASWSYVAVTIRLMNQATTLAPGTYCNGTYTGATASFALTLPSVAVQSGWGALFWAWSVGGGTALPSGWTALDDSGNSGANYVSSDTSDGAQLAGRTFSSSGSVPATSYTRNIPNTGVGLVLLLPQAPDVTTALTTATPEVDTALAVTGSNLAKVTSFLNTAVAEVDTAGLVFTPLNGEIISQPILLSGDPVTASGITWTATAYAAGSHVFVHTSIDNGASWQRCTSGGAIPNLLPGNTTATAVLIKVIFARALVTDPTPQCTAPQVSITFDSGAVELVSLGKFLIDEADITVTGGTTGGSGGSSGGGDGVTGTGGGNTGGALSITVTGTDLSLGVSRNAWEDVHFIPYGTNVGDAVQDILEDRQPGGQYNFASTEETTPQLILGTSQGSDPLQDAQDITAGAGYCLYLDANGIWIFRPIPDPTQGEPVWEFDDGMNPTVVSVQRTVNDQTTYNYIIVTGESTSNTAPVSAVAFDNNPNSATYIYGPYGRKAYSFTSQAIVTPAQAQAAADALLLLSLGACDTTVLTNVPMPALEPWDIVSVNIAEAKASGNYLLNTITTPLSGAEAQESTVYRQGQS